jgi:uncharacterized protein
MHLLLHVTCSCCWRGSMCACLPTHLRSTMQPENEPQPIDKSELPIFRLDQAFYAVFYAPGYVCAVALKQADIFARWLVDTCEAAPLAMTPHIAQLRAHAVAAMARQHAPERFVPECLTIYLHNCCNLRCSYCFSAAAPDRQERVSLAAIAAAAHLAAKACAEYGRPLAVGLHGGGEPSIDTDFAAAALAAVTSAAERYGVRVFRYIATNGVCDESTATWLTRNFDQVGLSCDGPAAVQDAQRPLWNGGRTSPQVCATARILGAAGTRFLIRATITAATATRQVELADYFCTEFAPAELHFEPVYGGGRASGMDQMPAASIFVEHLLAARRTAAGYGIPLIYAGARLHECHGPFCNVLRNVLNLVPGDVVTACFKCTTRNQARQHSVAIGAYDTATMQMRLDYDRIAALQRQLRTPPSCRSCFNRFHCAGACPDSCALTTAGSLAGSFRCEVQKQLAITQLLDSASRIWRGGQSAPYTKDQVYGSSIT